ncbi:DUF1353 domain-containing protein [Helicobacter sp. 11S02629-2]|uniref:DUF1353 domain-containing protein n=1 Tax=Helicobacter sp. 11S02629-2 TaxID=1476195 RepID=UPI000BA5E4EF|nr:DUF1353 domain-containing protein [Helicobacter sp. 11S02629-2]PAF44172.1 hypothetical protein BKH40_06135 [Helicobacter sp. 11S02629-2]
MSSFTKPLKVEVLEDGKSYKVLEPFYYYREDDNSKTIDVPVGFITDFASTPRILWSVLPPFGRYAKASVIHDFLCERFHKGLNTRKEADYIFLEALKASKVAPSKIYTLFLGVRLYSKLKGYK